MSARTHLSLVGVRQCNEVVLHLTFGYNLLPARWFMDKLSLAKTYLVPFKAHSIAINFGVYCFPLSGRMMSGMPYSMTKISRTTAATCKAVAYVTRNTLIDLVKRSFMTMTLRFSCFVRIKGSSTSSAKISNGPDRRNNFSSSGCFSDARCNQHVWPIDIEWCTYVEKSNY